MSLNYNFRLIFYVIFSVIFYYVDNIFPTTYSYTCNVIILVPFLLFRRYSFYSLLTMFFNLSQYRRAVGVSNNSKFWLRIAKIHIVATYLEILTFSGVKLQNRKWHVFQKVLEIRALRPYLVLFFFCFCRKRSRYVYFSCFFAVCYLIFWYNERNYQDFVLKCHLIVFKGSIVIIRFV